MSVTAGQAPADDDRNRCPRTQHIDGKSHGWQFWGDDPYVLCAWCGQMRDALTDRVVIR